MKKKPKHRNRWRRYEAEKKPWLSGDSPPAAYEKSLQELTKKLKL